MFFRRTGTQAQETVDKKVNQNRNRRTETVAMVEGKEASQQDSEGSNWTYDKDNVSLDEVLRRDRRECAIADDPT